MPGRSDTVLGQLWRQRSLAGHLIGHICVPLRQVKSPHKASLLAGFYGQDGEHLICCTACHEVVTRRQGKQLAKLRTQEQLSCSRYDEVVSSVGRECGGSWRQEGKLVFGMPRETQALLEYVYYHNWYVANHQARYSGIVVVGAEDRIMGWGGQHLGKAC